MIEAQRTQIIRSVLSATRRTHPERTIQEERADVLAYVSHRIGNIGFDEAVVFECIAAGMHVGAADEYREQEIPSEGS